MVIIKLKKKLQTVSRTYCECSGMSSFRWTHSGKMIIGRTTVTGKKCVLYTVVECGRQYLQIDVGFGSTCVHSRGWFYTVCLQWDTQLEGMLPNRVFVKLG